jgi:hypothetical protein
MAGHQFFQLGHETEHGRVFAGQAFQVADHGARIVLVAGFLEGDGAVMRTCIRFSASNIPTLVAGASRR